MSDGPVFEQNNPLTPDVASYPVSSATVPDRQATGLGGRTARASLTVVIGQLLSIGIRLVCIGVLARVLMAEDFGVAALVLYIGACVAQLRMGGLQQFLVRCQKPTRNIEGTANLLNVVLGLAKD